MQTFDIKHGSELFQYAALFSQRVVSYRLVSLMLNMDSCESRSKIKLIRRDSPRAKKEGFITYNYKNVIKKETNYLIASSYECNMTVL